MNFRAKKAYHQKKMLNYINIGGCMRIMQFEVFFVLQMQESMLQKMEEFILKLAFKLHFPFITLIPRIITHGLKNFQLYFSQALRL